MLVVGIGAIGSTVKAESYVDFIQYEYDGLNRLKRASTGAGQAQIFEHDDVFNRTEETRLVVPQGAPYARSDVYSLTENTTLIVGAASGVLLNDDFGAEEVVSATMLTSPLFGTFSLGVDGSFTYTPQAEFHGRDEFAYQVASNDSGYNSNVVRVILTVLPENDQPQAMPDGANEGAVVAENSAVLIPVLANDLHVDTLLSVGNPFHGTTSIDQPTNQVLYTPDPEYNGTDTFNYVASSAEGTSSAQVTVTINASNDPPQAGLVTAQTTDGVLVVIPILSLVEDPENDALELLSVTGTSTATITLVDGDVEYLPGPYVPEPNQNYMREVLTYTVEDSANNSVSEPLVVYTFANTEPVAIDDCYDTSLSVECTPSSAYEITPEQAATLNVLANDFDIAGEPIHIDSITLSPMYGTVAIVNDEVLYTPNPNVANQPDQFEYQIADSAGQTDTAMVYLLIKPEDNTGNLPIARDDCFDAAASPGCGVSLDYVVDYGGSTTMNVLANDSDPNGETFYISNVSTSAEGVTISQSGNTLIYSAPSGSIDGFQDSFTYEITNDSGLTAQATVYLKVRSQTNHAPVAVADTFTVFINEPRDLLLTTNDTDADYDTLSIVENSLTVPQPNGSLQYLNSTTVRYIPATNDDSQVTFSYKVTDGEDDSVLTTVTINLKPKQPWLPVLYYQLLLDDELPGGGSQ